MRHATALSSLLVVVAAVAGCGGSSSTAPVGFSAPVGIDVGQLKAGDVGAGNAVSLTKNINTAPSNPVKAFMNQARQVLGRDPSHVEVAALQLELLDTSTGFSPVSLDAVFTSTVSVGFVMNTSNNEYPVGTAFDPTGTTTAMTVDFDSANLTTGDRTDFAKGAFSIVLGGTAKDTFKNASGAQADLKTTFRFAAFP